MVRVARACPGIKNLYPAASLNLRLGVFAEVGVSLPGERFSATHSDPSANHVF
jgi:hypothetical protein